MQEWKVCKNRGNDSFKQGQLHDAIQHWQEALDTLPEHEEDDLDTDISRSRLLCNVALVRLKLNQPEETVRLCTEAMAFEPDFGKAYFRYRRSNRWGWKWGGGGGYW